jgi:hypothetical protein
MDIAVRRCLFHAEENWGYYLTLFVHAYGATENEAETAWTLAQLSLREVLDGISKLESFTRTGWEFGGRGGGLEEGNQTA